MKNNVVVGIDVSKDFNYLCMIGPDGRKISKPFKVLHTLNLAEINILCRQYFRLSDYFTKYKNHLVSLVCHVFPNYVKVFSDITSESSLYILENFPSPNKLLKADKETLVQTIANWLARAAIGL